MKKRIMKLALVVLCLSASLLPITARKEVSDVGLKGDAKSVYLMEYTSGKVIYAEHENKRLYPASMTKMMGLLLIYEALHDGQLQLDDMVTTSEFAASMGGSHVFLEPQETLSAEDMIKSICIASANDAMVAMGEHLAGSHEAFVNKMNRKAKELGMNNTHFMNATGLHDDKHYTTAKDMALLGQALLKEGGEELLKITSTYDAYIREDSDKKFWLVNTNKLLKQVEGVDGLKTGFTKEALSCITVSAKRKELRLIAVVMGASNAKARNAIASGLLEYGFAQYAQGLLYAKGTRLDTLSFENGKPKQADIVALEDISYVFEKGKEPKEKHKEITITKKKLPYQKNEKIGTVRIEMSDGYYMEAPIGVNRTVLPLDFSDILLKTMRKIIA
ncbi:MAG: D-alanyl-D-alanine carboxypeptidase [Amedibacillus dolichus]|uniref:D-alanyl-D-alanine carboxypeptidase family protein n=1 Tax=Amedibacillus dolichus TaxID=31971 RepID=UPI000D7A7D0C|nr:D-alanyl-D-alanine carboxypeptidase family protein [Amedibacillus dolichus]MCB5373223.1 D-alanyl-D-alanine carboxypeptidase [Amedibacillus dolichus]PWL66060.1 MAG: D-alanyl-D-alanine carboxypeptidase [Amedibacillus dolichus]